MSELMQRYGEKISATYLANLAFFKEKLPGFYQMMESKSGGVEISAHVDEDGLIKLSLDGNMVELQDILEQARNTMEAFDSPETRPYIVASSAASMTDGKSILPDSHNKRYFISNVDYRTRLKLDECTLKHVPMEKRLARPSFGTRGIPILIVFGSGYGSHIIELLDRYDVRHLIIVDNDPAITRLSMGFTDYVAIYNNHLVRGMRLSMVSTSDPELINQLVGSAISSCWPPFFVHGITVFRNMRNVALCEEVEKKLADTLWLVFRGWGFFDDEMLSIRHTIANLNRKLPLCRVTRPVPEDAVAFVVANGPSLDRLADLVKQHHESAVILTCGSALSAVHRLGIMPDYHIEIERTYSTVESIRYAVPLEFTKKIRLVGTTVLHPAVYEDFAEGLMVRKTGDTTGSVIPAEYLEVSTFPTVANGAVGWLLAMGFKRIYLIGTDMGTRDESQHHSTHSLYFEADSMPEDYKKTLTQGNPHAMPMETDANFGGKVRTNDQLTLSRLSLESQIAAYPGCEIFNLNDGALIKHTQPLAPEDFVMPANLPAKQPIIEQMRASFVQPDNFDATSCRDAVARDVRAFVDGLKESIRREANTKMAMVDKLAAIYATASEMAKEHKAAWWTLRGSLLHVERYIYDCMTYTVDDATSAAFGAEAFGLLEEFLEEAARSMESIEVDAPLPKVGAEVELEKHFQELAA